MKLVLTILIICCFQFTLFSQVGINTISPKATLDIESSSLTNPSNVDGLLIPKVEEFPTTNPTIDQDGMQVFVTGNGSAARGFYFWDHSTTTWTTISSTAIPSDDWYENGSITNPDDITDAIYTYGAVGIGIQPSVGNLEVTQATNEITASFINTADTNLNSLPNIEGIKNTLSGTTNAIPQIGLHSTLSGSGTNEQTALKSTISGSGTGSKNGLMTTFEPTSEGTIKGIQNNIESNSDSDQISVENNFTGTGTGLRRGIRNSFSNTKGSIAGMENEFSNDIQGARYGTINRFLDANSGGSSGTLNSYQGAGNSSAIYGGTQNVFSTSNYAIITGYSNSITTAGSGQSRGMNNGFNGTGTGNKIGVSNVYFASNQGGNQTAIDNRFEGNSDILILGMRNQFENTSTSNYKIGVTNLLKGPTSISAIGTANAISTSGNGVVIGARNSVGNALFNMTAEAFGIQNRLYPKSTLNAFGLLNDFNFDENTGNRYGILNRFDNAHTGNKTGFQNEFVANGTETVNGLTNLFDGAGGTMNGLLNEFAAVSSSNQIGVNNEFSGTGVGAKRGAINTFTSLGGGTAYGTLNEFNNLNGTSASGFYNVFSGSNDLSIYGTQNVFNSSGDGAIYGSSTVINSTGSGFKYGHYVRIPAAAGGFHVGIYSEALKPSAAAAVFRGRVKIGSVFAQEYTLPLDRGAANQVLQTDGSGNVNWVDNPSASFWQRSGNTLSLANTGDVIRFTNPATSITFPAISSASPSLFYLFESGTTNTDRMIFSQSPTFSNYGLLYRDFDDSFRFVRNGFDRVVINVGSITTPLVVTGTIQATNFQSATTTYPDYVFDHYYEGTSSIDPDYSFPTIKEVEQYIKSNGHLPGVLPFSEIKKKGMQIDLAKAAVTNLEKIEELFLYTIELNKENEQLKLDNKVLLNQQQEILVRLQQLEEKLD